MASEKSILIGNVKIGGGADIAIQSMTNTKTNNVDATVKQIKELEKAGCDIVRVTVPDMDSAYAIDKIKEKISIPLVADIHFDYKIALESVRLGADKIRINPGNIGEKWKVREVAQACASNGLPIRIGVNSGSLEKEILLKYGSPCAEALAESAMNHVALLEQCDFKDIIISIKSSSVNIMTEA
jgi:(E)-4-hydroxy-3-methylbut-2-enyl-diphosphate synthase